MIIDLTGQFGAIKIQREDIFKTAVQIASLIAIIREIVGDDRAVHYIELVKVMTKRPRASLCGNCHAHYDKMDKRRFVKRNCDIVTRQRFLFTLVERSIRLNQRQNSATGNFANQQRNMHSMKWCVRRCVCRCVFDKASRQFNQTSP